MSSSLFNFNPPERGISQTVVRTYQALSSASVEELWNKITDLEDVSWHPIIASTNVPYGLVVKPGLIYQAFTRLIPIPIQIFVERVRPQEALSIRILVLPGLEEQVTYQIESTVCGTCVSYSVTLRGWLAPLLWSLMRPCAAQVALKLAQSAEQSMLQTTSGNLKPSKRDCFDF